MIRVGSIVIGVDGLLVTPADPDVLAAAVLRLSRDVVTRRDLSAAGRRRVEDRFNADESVRRIEAVYVAELAEPRYAASARSAKAPAI